jgi:hypothetical protein
LLRVNLGKRFRDTADGTHLEPVLFQDGRKRQPDTWFIVNEQNPLTKWHLSGPIALIPESGVATDIGRQDKGFLLTLLRRDAKGTDTNL